MTTQTPETDKAEYLVTDATKDEMVVSSGVARNLERRLNRMREEVEKAYREGYGDAAFTVANCEDAVSIKAFCDEDHVKSRASRVVKGEVVP